MPPSSIALAVAAGVAGLVLAPVAASVSQGMMALHRAVVAGLLCDSERQVLERRVETLEGSRKAVLDVEATELRRIERDLHDGAQQRLVMLTIDLSLAAERIDSDPAAARALVVEAQDQARLALAELRDLVRGIAPAILLDRGLVPALSAIAGRCPVPTVVESTLPAGERLPDATERAAYFVVAEAIANVAKHASAGRCEIRCRSEAGRLVVEVWDDGAGGARAIPGGGLAGLAGRVEALDGSLTVESPAGGPTLVHAEMPLPAGPGG
jgi:signal transduction histidine kinase